MRGQDFSHVEALARRCALKGLMPRDARRLFDELYLADMLMLTRGNLTEASARMRVARTTLPRRMARHAADLPEWDEV